MKLALLSSCRPLPVQFRWVRPIFWSAALVLVVLGLTASPVFADRADQYYKRALKDYENKDYPSAIREFQAAYRVRQLPKILLNIGQVYRKLGMASTALKFYEHYLRVEPNPKPEIKAEVDRYIAQTRAMLDPPEFVTPPSVKMSAAEAAAAAVAAAPSDVTPVTVPELYSDDDLPSLSQVGQRDATGKIKARPGAAETPQVENSAGPAAMRPAPGVLAPAPPQWNTPLPLLPNRPAEPMAPPPNPPFYKQKWFWAVVGGVAGVALITGVAVGVQRTSAGPADVLHPGK